MVSMTTALTIEVCGGPAEGDTCFMTSRPARKNTPSRLPVICQRGKRGSLLGYDHGTLLITLIYYVHTTWPLYHRSSSFNESRFRKQQQRVFLSEGFFFERNTSNIFTQNRSNNMDMFLRAHKFEYVPCVSVSIHLLNETQFSLSQIST